MSIDLPIAAVLTELATKRPIFHSEADFQHEFAWLIRKTMPDLEVRLEYPFPAAESGAVDILLRRVPYIFAVELKYLCRLMATRVGEEDFTLKHQGAQDTRRYDVIKDISRMERLVATVPAARAAVVVLSNDPAYWTGPKGDDANSAAFSLREQRIVSGFLDWSPRTGAGTKKGREPPIQLRGTYHFTWHKYSQLNGPMGKFMYLSIPVVLPNAGEIHTNKVTL